ncbi:GtrA family protein [Desulfosporosinus sp. SYSU MS00001]|uniref:GtrA family protein n=1 Tax=Desulfosporosinus sp. SYSU MS00001 TaxID=3416284 RepID=UPI003CFB579B
MNLHIHFAFSNTLKVTQSETSAANIIKIFRLKKIANNPTLLIIFNTAAYLLAIVNSYIWNSRFAFRNHAQKNLREKIYFCLQAGVSLIISNFVFLEGIHFLTLCRFSLWFIQSISKILAMVTPSIVSFLFMKYFVFRRNERLSSPERLTNS